MGFEEIFLKEVAVIKNGKKPKTKKEIGDYPIFGSNGVIGYTDEAYIHQDSIIIGRVGANCGSVIFSTGGFWVSDNAISVVPKESTDVIFLYYLLITKRINEYSSGSAQPLINQSILNSIPLMLPKYGIQKRIGEFLQSIDRKIDLNSQVISNLEQLAQTLFKRWFVDFEFPNENGEPYKSSGGEMVESELGMIPANWTPGTLEDIGSIVGGATPSKKIEEYYTEDAISWVTPKDLSKDKSVYIYKGAIDITDAALKKSSAKVHPKNTVLFSSRAPIGYVAIAGKSMATNQGFKSIIPAKGISSEYVFLLLKHLTPIIEATATGSTFKEISGAGMKGIKTLIPPTKLLLEYEKIVFSLFEQIKSKENEKRSLVSLRDTLLPKLLSGEIEISDETEVTEDVPIP